MSQKRKDIESNEEDKPEKKKKKPSCAIPGGFPEYPVLQEVLKRYSWTTIKDPIFTPKYEPHLPSWKNIPTSVNPIDYFKCMVNQKLVDRMLYDSNKLDQFQNAAKLQSKEVYTYIGLILVSVVMGISNHPDLFSHGEYSYTYPGKGEAMGKDRFSVIHPHLTINLEKMRSILETNFLHHLSPGTFLTIDESRIKAKPTMHAGLSYNKEKPEKWAFEINTIGDTDTRYLLGMMPSKEATGEIALAQLIEKMPLDKDKHYHLTADSKFSNFAQLKRLKLIGIEATLCIKKGRLPSEVYKVGIANCLPPGLSRFATQEGIIAAAYHNKKIIQLATTFFDVQESPERRLQSERQDILDLYDDTKRGLDQFNQLATYFWHDHPHSSQQQSQQLGYISYALTNSYIMYTRNVKDPMSHRNYVKSIAKSLLVKNE
ncbi:hypothetical protein SAMD00019534_013080 [Acytostelium subglobosum LB1]|uniref:hypothetical protein n=1 Tax=Acytostelium subglobosum LB1 TaxID=1410327 RepID=UPI000644F39F|nr:hypothetical protein SAMD00019534_116440 [Acytostelium subglobosum LB1]XP_012758729.1 hypothetical protein SAMD00019534_013080 [Acytostelium subglobosum LB1]GAM18133.1 hypothetical protein SAMD00019534_013080 [Acytostelium subglobosum LB1]GAM28468.1 hypothetical protein SAMD00019534_116440 [Acytostelium subglobosum LB1]|eukprot:XP_012748507.1 hypothetical protein SAMD00019534_116440 [Acytostelium subglobosum LB1]